MSRAHTLFLSGFLFSLAPFAHALAEEPANPFAQYATCAATQPEAERLACYDALAPVMAAAAEAGESIAAQRAEAFGAEDFAEDGDLDDIDKLSQIRSGVAKIEMMANRRLKITLENGQVWRQDPDDRIIPAPKEGVARSAAIRRVMLGRYTMTLEPEGRTLRVQRSE